jgi:hypothetical protein
MHLIFLEEWAKNQVISPYSIVLTKYPVLILYKEKRFSSHTVLEAETQDQIVPFFLASGNGHLGFITS